MKSMGIWKFFDLFEDKIRVRLSKTPLLYGLIGGTAIVVFWRGIWMIMDWLTRDMSVLESALFSIAVSLPVLLATGLFVSFFIGDSILISGIRKEKKLIEKTEEEINEESGILLEIDGDLHREQSVLARIERNLLELKALHEKRDS